MAVVAAVLDLFVSLASAALFLALPCCGKTAVGEEEEDTWLVSQPPPSARARDKEPGNYFLHCAVEGGAGRRASGEGLPAVCTMCLEVLLEAGDAVQRGRRGAGEPPPGLRRAALEEDKIKCPMCRGRGRIVPASDVTVLSNGALVSCQCQNVGEEDVVT